MYIDLRRWDLIRKFNGGGIFFYVVDIKVLFCFKIFLRVGWYLDMYWGEDYFFEIGFWLI